MTYVLGVDAGNTKTVALVAGIDGRILGAGRSGCGDIYGASSAEAAISAVEDAVNAALRSSDLGLEALAAACFSMAGADWPEDYDFLRTAMTQRGFGRAVMVTHDAIGALRAGSPDGTGVAVVCGTGAAIGARAPDGSRWHTSFWQEPLGALELGRKTLHAVYRAELGIDPPTSLTARVLDVFGQCSVEQMLHVLTARQCRQVADVARLAPLLLDEASNGDAAARDIVQGHGTALGDYALAAARRVGLEGTPFPLVLAGGVLRGAIPLLAEPMIARIRTTSPDVRPIKSPFEPVIGAVFLALDTLGVSVDNLLIERLLPTIPPDSLFAT